MHLLMTSILILTISSAAMAEIVQTKDGRTIELNADGTYRMIEGESSGSILLTERKSYFEHFAGDYNQNSMRFMPIFLNETGKTVVGFRFVSTFKSAFGDTVFSFNGESSERIAPSGLSTADTFYFFEDNQFIANEPYDNLKIFEAAGTGEISTIVTAVVFDDGSVIKFSP